MRSNISVFCPLNSFKKAPVWPFLLILVALLAVHIAIFALLELLKKGLWLESRSRFASKAPSAPTTARITPAAHVCIANTTRKIYRVHVLTLSSSCKSPISYCMLPFADLQLDAEHELKGGGVALPRGPSINSRIAQSQPQRICAKTVKLCCLSLLALIQHVNCNIQLSSRTYWICLDSADKKVYLRYPP